MIHIGGSRNGFLTSVNGDSITKGSGTIDYSSLAVSSNRFRFIGSKYGVSKKKL